MGTSSRARESADRGNADARPRALWQIVGTALMALAGLVLLASGAAKFAQAPRVVLELGRYGFSGGRLTLVACLEVASVLLLLAPRTRRLGLLFVSAFMGGAIATHLQHGTSILPPAFVLAILWAGAALRHPDVLGTVLDS